MILFYNLAIAFQLQKMQSERYIVAKGLKCLLKKVFKKVLKSC